MAALACDYVWTHGDVLLNPHYGASGLHGSELWTYTLPRRVPGGRDQAVAITSALQPMDANGGVSAGIVDAVLCSRRRDFWPALVARSQELTHDERHLQEVLREKAARLGSPTALRDMHRARVFEGIVTRDNLRDAGHEAARRAWVMKQPPTTTPMHLAGQRDIVGRVLDGKALAEMKVREVKEAVTKHAQVSYGF